MEITLFPLEKAQIDGKAISFGMKKEDGYSYSFKEIEVGVYRESKPEDAMECIEEMKAEGTCTKEDEEYELRRANHWATIGIGVKGYY